MAEQYTNEEMIDLISVEKMRLLAYLKKETTQKQCGNPKGVYTDDSKCVCTTHCQYCYTYAALRVIDNKLMSAIEKLRALHIPVVKETTNELG